jgi:RHS repeat-associated protein
VTDKRPKAGAPAAKPEAAPRNERATSGSTASGGAGASSFSIARPSGVATPKGGGAIRSIGEKFSMNAATGTGSLSVPVATSPGRPGFELGLTLGYDSGAGNSPFGLGWSLSVPAITRKTDKRLPTYVDDDDVFVLSGAEDLVPVRPDSTSERHGHRVRRYRPRTEGLFARIERWERTLDGDVHWRVTTRENVTNIYGRDPAARIADPQRPESVFSWLLEETRDDRGNVASYQYKAEDGLGIEPALAESSRFGSSAPHAFLATAQRYVKRIRYGNRTPFEVGNWCFECVFDYGEHDDSTPAPEESRTWGVRPDAFSSYKPGFEVRTYRLCRRILMFHRFPELSRDPSAPRTFAELGRDATLVRSTDLFHEVGAALTYLVGVQQVGYVREGASYRRATLPRLDLDYVRPKVHDAAIDLDDASLEGAARGFEGGAMQWRDLDGEGLAGLLLTPPGGWYYKRNLGDGRLGPPRRLASLPAPAELGGGVQQLDDVDGDGRLELVSYAAPLAGYFSRTREQTFGPFRAFRELPNIDWRDPNLRFIDLDGDGHADALVTEADAFVWYPSHAKNGFGPARRTSKGVDEDSGPRVVFADGTETIQLADMSGDGLVDIVRVRNREVSYWPNLGYGRFGPRVVLQPERPFDDERSFDPRRLRFIDVDGSGTSDVVYLAASGATIYFNQSGNALRWGGRIESLPTFVTSDQVVAVDLLGTGTACLVWTTPSPRPRTIRYVDLMGGVKPHVLRRVENNLGARTTITYASSTRFYLEDQYGDEPWITRLPFPVQVVETVTHEDLLNRTALQTRYAYHHGYFDGEEREFRGFAKVEQWDAEILGRDVQPDPLAASADPAEALRLAPVRTVTWFHTGAWLEQTTLERELRKHYKPSDPLAPELGDTPAMRDLSLRDEREATRALRGSMLRQEIYADDGSDRRALPYSVVEKSYWPRKIQGSGQREQELGVFFVEPDQTFTVQYERRPTDGRVQHELVLRVDEFGNVLEAVQVGYGRKPSPLEATSELPGLGRAKTIQERNLVTLTRTAVTGLVDGDSGYRVPLPCERRVDEIVGFELDPETRRRRSYFVPSDLTALGALPRVDYGLTPGAPPVHRRRVEHTRTLFRTDDLASVHPLGTSGVRAHPYQEYQLALTHDLVASLFVRPRSGSTPERLLPDASVLASQGGYVRRADLVAEGRFPRDDPGGDDHDDDWWAPSGVTFFNPSAGPGTDELAFAEQHFYLPHRARDPFGGETVLRHDRDHLVTVEAADPVGNRTIAGERDAAQRVTDRVDYRVLQPSIVSDANRNRVAFAFDALGMVVGSALMGKPEESLGDHLAGFVTDLDEASLLAYLEVPRAQAAGMLAGATQRFVYDVHAYARSRATPDPRCPVVSTLARETHVSSLRSGETSRIQLSFTYYDGLGREIQRKLPAEPGPVLAGGPVVTERWVGSGWVVLDNKGNPVRKYEPFFATTHRFELEHERGVSATLFYDPAARVIGTLHPNHTFEKVDFDAWSQTTWDVNDTVLMDPAADDIVGHHVQRLPKSDYAPTWFEARRDGQLQEDERDAARQAALHADTRTIVHVDPLGRSILTVTHNRTEVSGTRVDERAGTFTDLDIEGLQRSVRDPLDREVMRYAYDVRGNRIHSASMDSGERWMLADVTGQPVAAWDTRGHTLRTAYDAARRPTLVTLEGQAGHPGPIVHTKTEYGENTPNDERLNLRSRALRVADGAGVVSFVGRETPTSPEEAYDFKGNPCILARRLAKDYRRLPDWSSVVDLDADTFTTVTRVDALNRPVRVTTPDQSTSVPTFNEANLLERVEVYQRGRTSPTTFVANIDYDAKGQRLRIEYGNGTNTSYRYDPHTFRVVGLKTARPAARFANDCPGGRARPCGIQNLTYTYDPVGNITRLRDDAQPTIFFDGDVTDGTASYTYDALYRLRSASGREHVGQAGSPWTSWDDAGRVGLAHPHDFRQMRPYTQAYDYDRAGNFRELAHWSGATRLWTRTYLYDHASLLEPAFMSNALGRTEIRSNSGNFDENCRYHVDAHGNLVRIENGHLAGISWDAFDRIASSSRQSVTSGVPETTYYTYDASGERVRKVTDGQAAAGIEAKRREERIYLAGYELYRRHESAGVTLERQTLHVNDDARRIALVETRSAGNDGSPPELIRYQLGNHLGTVGIELDGDCGIISHEEFHPYGTTSFQGVRGGGEAPKRYRYTGKERDEETGFSYHSARYYAPWLGRWTSADPEELRDSTNVFSYVRDNPLIATDPTGTVVWLVPVAIYLGYKALTSAAETGVEAGIAKATGDKDFSLGGTFLKNMAVNTVVGLIPGASEGKLAAKIGIYAAKVAIRTAGDTTLDAAQGKGTLGKNILKNVATNLGGDAAGKLLGKATKFAKGRLTKALSGEAGEKAVTKAENEAINSAASGAEKSLASGAESATETSVKKVEQQVTEGAAVATELTVAAEAKAASKTLPAALQGGEATVHVYFGVRNGERVYVGITNDLARRQSEHGDRFILQAITQTPVTRGEARAIEQALIQANPGFENVRNSISPRHSYYQQAVEWGQAWLKNAGY